MTRTLAGLSFLAVSLACGGWSPTEGAWPRATAERFVPLSKQEHTTGLVFLPDNTLAVSTFTREKELASVRFFRPDGGAAPFADLTFAGRRDVWGFTAAPDGSRVALAFDDEVVLAPITGGDTVSLPLRDEGDSTEALLGACRSPWRLSWAGDTILADCSIGPPAVLLDTVTGARRLALPREVDGLRLHVSDHAASPDGTLYALRVEGHLFPDEPEVWIDLRRAHDGGVVRTFTAEGLPQHIAFSPDGQRIAASHPYFGLQLFDVATGGRVVDERYEGDREDSGNGDVVYGPDALFRVGRRHGISAHDPSDGRVLGWLPQHPEDTYATKPSGWPDDLSYQNQLLAVSPDGRWIASIQSRDWTLYAVRFWALR